MEIIVRDVLPVNDNKSHKKVLLRKAPARFMKDRRKNNWDRRKSVRSGVIVSLSSRKDRRVFRERRKILSS